MSSPAEQPTLVLIRRQADGTIEWIRLETPLQRVPATPEAAYALIDRTDYEAPQTLVTQRVGEDLVVGVDGTEVLVLDNFFATVDVAFYPTTDIVGGAGPFSGTPLTPDSPMVAAPPSDQVVWSAEPPERAAEVPPAGGAVSSGSSPLLWVGVAAGGLGLAALAGGGGGSGGGEGGGGEGGGSAGPAADTVAPRITSGGSAATVNENSGPNQVVYTATATDTAPVTYSLRADGDAAAFSINTTTGAVTLTGTPDFETKSRYAFTVVATDASNNRSEQTVSLAISDLDDSGPSITSGATAPPINENSGAGRVVYTVTATDAGPVTFSLKPDGDAAAFSIDAATGAVTLTGNPDFETKSSYAFTVVATDAANNRSEQPVSLSIADLDIESAPQITSGAVAPAINENSGAGQVVYTAAATDVGAVTFSLKPGVGDAADFTINGTTGAVTLKANPNDETKGSYAFTVVAADVDGNRAEQLVTLAINDLDEVPPNITSVANPAVNENIGANQVVYTVTSTDAEVITGSTTYTIRPGPDSDEFTINGSSGAVTLIENPNDEIKGSYNFTVRATDAAGNFDEQAVFLNINDLDEVAPTIRSGAIAPAIDEGIGPNQVVYTVTSTDTDDISAGSTTYTIRPGPDADEFTINGNLVRLTENPNFEDQASYSFTVRATDAVGNFSEQAVTLAINNRDEVAPIIESGATATPITENSGANQVVYTITSTDAEVITGSTTYTIRPGPDSDEFTITNGNLVRLIDNPNFEDQASYNFTVRATDAAGNFDEQAVTLAINDVADETPPEVDDVALTGAIGALNGALNAGDTVQVTVRMTENTLVSGTPRVALDVGTSQQFANYVSGSGTTSLIFEYTIQPGDSDSNGIRIPGDALELNGGSLADAAGNAADLDHGSVSGNSSFIVDTTAPTLFSSEPDDGDDDFDRGDDIELTFSDDMQTGSGNIVISSEFETLTINVNDGSQVSISGNDVTIDPTFDLLPGTRYSIRIDGTAFTDDAGNAFAGIDDDSTLNFETDENIFNPFGLAQGSSTDQSSRTFESDPSLAVEIRLDANDATPSTAGGDLGTFSGSADLGSDDRVTLVGSGADAHGPSAPVAALPVSADTAAWQSSAGSDARSFQVGSNTTLVDASLPGTFPGDLGGQTNIMDFANLPAGTLTSQGLV